MGCDNLCNALASATLFNDLVPDCRRDNNFPKIVPQEFSSLPVAARWMRGEESLTAPGMGEILLQILLVVMTCRLAFPEQFLPFPADQPGQGTGFPGREDAPSVKRQSKFLF